LFTIADRNGNLPKAIADAAQLAISSLKLEGITADLIIGEGAIAAGILAAARKTDADLIVLYRHTRSGLSRKLLGSVGDQVIRGADIPVLLTGESGGIGLNTAG
jgi:nucleotide-binding universal stress UspA family protein